MSDITEKNRSHWNEAASTYNTKFSKTIEQIISEIQSRRDWIGADWVEDGDSSDNESGARSSDLQNKKEVRLLDYACGTGLVSRALAPYVTQCVGIDISEGMVNEYNTSARNQGIPKNEMFATLGNLLDASSPLLEHLSGPEFFSFDIAAVGLGFHHFDDPALAAKRLAERLKKGGVLMIVDFLPHGDMHGHHHGHKHGHGHNREKVAGDVKEGDPNEGDWKAKVRPTVAHMGFSEEDVKKMFEGAGVGGGFECVSLGKGVVFGEEVERVERSVFMARGSKL